MTAVLRCGRLKFPGAPCLSVGTSARPVGLPPEVCRLKKGQRKLKLDDRQTAEVRPKHIATYWTPRHAAYLLICTTQMYTCASRDRRFSCKCRLISVLSQVHHGQC